MKKMGGFRRAAGWRRARYAAPAVVLVAVGGVAAVPNLSGAASTPNLPAQSVQQLVADMVAAKPPALSGTLTWTANLGLSGLSTLESELGGSGSASESFNPLSLLSGSYQLQVWLDGSNAEHLSLATGASSEVDLVRNANQAWLWDSATQRVDYFVGPTGSSATSPSAGAGALATPAQVASNILDQLSPTTAVTEGTSIYVAGQPAYQLVVTPQAGTAPASTVDYVSIAVGSSGALLGVPLQVAAYAKGVTGPALSLGFTGSLSLAVPPSSQFTFVPPPGSTVVTHDVGSGTSNGGSFSGLTGTGTSGSGWATVVHGTSSALAGATAQAELQAVTTPVTVGGQQARLFSTNLLNALVMPNGQFYAGFVLPSALEAAAAQGS